MSRADDSPVPLRILERPVHPAGPSTTCPTAPWSGYPFAVPCSLTDHPSVQCTSVVCSEDRIVNLDRSVRMAQHVPATGAAGSVLDDRSYVTRVAPERMGFVPNRIRVATGTSSNAVARSRRAHEPHGIWGGTTPEERDELRRLGSLATHESSACERPVPGLRSLAGGPLPGSAGAAEQA